MLLVSLMALTLSLGAYANPLRIAVAANFKSTLEQILPKFHQAYPQIETQIISGSTGALYAQISHGAPFDLLLAADAERPQKLLAEKRALEIFHYTTGQLVYWVAGSLEQVDESTLRSAATPIAIANPNTAPYGAAARQTLASLNIQGTKFITGSNVSQSYQFIESGNVAAGFIALSQVINRTDSREWWLVPSRLYDSIVQMGALLPNHHAGATTFMNFLQSEPTQKVLSANGYRNIKTGTTFEQDGIKTDNIIQASRRLTVPQ